jgi:bile acid-coenzyme A ligase
MVLSGGANVYPPKAEATLLAHPAVTRVGLPDEDLGERVHAVVWLAPSSGTTHSGVPGNAHRATRSGAHPALLHTLRDNARKVRRAARPDRKFARLGL